MTGASNRLTALTKELFREWEQTRQFWNDAKSREFEERFINELMAGASQANNSIEILEQVLNKVRSECE
jgi:hypothetical protein